jgi:hypothetical protein
VALAARSGTHRGTVGRDLSATVGLAGPRLLAVCARARSGADLVP